MARGSVPTWRFTSSCRAALGAEPITLYGDGEQTRDFTFVTDAVAATVAAGDQGGSGRAYNVGGGSRVSVNQLFEIIGRIHGQPLDDPARSRRRRATCAIPSPTRPGPGPTSDFRPKYRSSKGSRPSIDWLANTPALVR